MRKIFFVSLAALALYASAGLLKKPAPLTAVEKPSAEAARAEAPQQTRTQAQTKTNANPYPTSNLKPGPAPKVISERLFVQALTRLEQKEIDPNSDAHVAGPEVGLSGSVIGKLISLGDREPEVRSRVLATFAACAENADSAVSVRAHCLASAVRMGERWGELFASTDVRASVEVESLAARLIAATTN